jgi:hypothetical protein
MNLLSDGVVMQTILTSTVIFLTKWVLHSATVFGQNTENLQFFSVNNDIDYRKPETKVIMNWVNQEHFTTSASLHECCILHKVLKYSYAMQN